MKKTATTFLQLLLAFVPLLSQEGHTKRFIDISTGLSVPYADFGIRKMERHAGFSGPGLNAEIGYSRFKGRYLGFSSEIGYSSLFFNEAAYLSEFDRALGGFGQNTMHAGNYQVLKLMTGLVLKIPVTRDIEALISTRIGAAMSVHPDLKVMNSEFGLISSISRNSDWNIASNAGLRVNCRLTDNYGVSLSYSLNATKPDFHDETSTEKTFLLPVRYMNINAGLVINLK